MRLSVAAASPPVSASRRLKAARLTRTVLMESITAKRPVSATLAWIATSCRSGRSESGIGVRKLAPVLSKVLRLYWKKGLSPSRRSDRATSSGLPAFTCR